MMSKSDTLIIPRNEENIQTPQGSPPDIVSIQKKSICHFFNINTFLTY